MSDPYTTPKAQGISSIPTKPRWRLLKHFCIFLAIFAALNFDRFFGSTKNDAPIPKVSIFASVITLLLFYGLGYAIFSRVRGRR
jgi:hypothetical protein